MRSLFRWVSRHRVLALVAAVGLIAAVRGRRSGGARPPGDVLQPAGTTERETPPLAVPIADALVVTPGPHPGSALPREDGSAPSPDFTVKGKTSSMRCHGPESPYFNRTKAEVWFRSESEAEAAGFRPWHPAGGS